MGRTAAAQGSRRGLQGRDPGEGSHRCGWRGRGRRAAKVAARQLPPQERASHAQAEPRNCPGKEQQNGVVRRRKRTGAADGHREVGRPTPVKLAGEELHQLRLNARLLHNAGASGRRGPRKQASTRPQHGCTKPLRHAAVAPQRRKAGPRGTDDTLEPK